MKTIWFLSLGILCISGMLSASRYNDDREEEESSGGQNIQEHNNSRTTSQNNVVSDFYRPERNTGSQRNPNQGSDNLDRNFSDRNSNNYYRDQSRNVIAQGNYSNNQNRNLNDRNWNENENNRNQSMYTGNKQNKNIDVRNTKYTKNTSYPDDDVRYSDYNSF